MKPNRNRTARQETLFPSDVFCKIPYEPKQIATSKLISGQPYQRPVKQTRIKEIMDNFDPLLLDEIVVNFRDGKFYVVDGQHRIVALRNLRNGEDVIVNCRVCTGLTYEQEADLYHRLDGAKKKLNLGDSVRAKVESGSDKETADITKILTANGIEWCYSGDSGTGGKNRIGNTRATINAYRLLGFEGFSRMIRMIKRTWGGNKNSLLNYMIAGMALFIKIYGDEVSEDAFVAKLSKCPARDIIEAGRTDKSTNDTALKYARVILNKYNFRKRPSEQLAYKFNG